MGVSRLLAWQPSLRCPVLADAVTVQACSTSARLVWPSIRFSCVVRPAILCTPWSIERGARICCRLGSVAFPVELHLGVVGMWMHSRLLIAA